jgi:hypothetical protein
MTDEQKKQIEDLKEEREEYISEYKAYVSLTDRINKIYKRCKHEKTESYRESDYHEGRSYWNIVCQDCGESWYER